MTRSHLHLRARPDRRHELLRELDRLEVVVAVADQPGFLAAALLVPQDEPDWVLVESSWSSLEHYERWRNGGAQTELLNAVRHLLAQEPAAAVYHVADAIG